MKEGYKNCLLIKFHAEGSLYSLIQENKTEKKVGLNVWETCILMMNYYFSNDSTLHELKTPNLMCFAPPAVKQCAGSVTVNNDNIY